ncbi:amino acid ABC transporter ATP-binding protein [Sporolactobacillus terrae]|uniref:Arginine ABC transporter ATP-binding protein n=1 Tax=Sporolactobacillus terrae TaxID=269673 RepID=A0A5K7X0Q6_9BACL|nr:amino acid ABC transporter ATP-binding protein [Sporolactobacillus terrae]BBN97656.1 arginine ABC transporter ATP-binding protein [Sporolactobacillus terrae]
MIQLENVSKSFKGTQVLKNINLTINQGEVVTLIGPSGAGKTTLLRLLNWLEVPDSGRITIGDAAIDAAKFSKQDVRCLRGQSSMVFQHYNLFKNKTVLENVTESLIVVSRIKPSEAKEKAVRLLDRVGMGHKLHDYPSNLSGGQQQRVGIARALAVDPKVMLFDEPTSALDPEWVGEILHVIKQIAAQGMTMILVSHEMRFVRSVASRIIFLENGELVEDSKPKELFENSKSVRTQAFLQKLTYEEE